MNAAKDALGFTKLTRDEYKRYYADDIEELTSKIGNVGSAIDHHLVHRCCSVPDRLGADGGVEEARWPEACSKNLMIHIDWSTFSGAMGINRGIAEAEYDRALSDWMRFVDLKWSLTNNRNAARIHVDFGSLSGNTLAWSHLANNSCGTGYRQRYDIRRWNQHQFYLVALHELGHLLGLPHHSGNFVMNPYIVTSLSGLTIDDIERARGLGYGPAKPTTPTPTPTPPDVKVVIPDTVVMVGGHRAGVMRFIPDGLGGGGTTSGGSWSDV